MRRLLAILFSTLLIAAACGGSSSDGGVAADAAGSDSSSSDTGSADSDSDEGDTSDDADAAVADTGDDSDDDDSDSSDAAPSGDLQELLQTAAVSTTELTTGRMAATITMQGGPDLPAPVELLLTGDFDFANQATALTLDLSGMMDSLADSDDPTAGLAGTFFEDPIEIITIGDTTWMKMGLLAALLGGGAEWIELTEDEFTATDQFLPGSTGAFDPQVFVGFLQGADDVEEVGSENIRGVATTHYRGVVTEEMLAQFDPDTALTDIGSTDEIPFDVWVDGDGFIRRMVMDVADTGDGSSMSLDWEMYDYGSVVDISPPPPELVTSADALGGLLGAG